MSKIIHPAAFIDALKNSGYRSTYNAISEIVDNSIDANAKNIFIIGEQSPVETNRGTEKRIKSFAFLDDGKGMDFSTLSQCLTIGYSDKKKKRGIGKFGVGLPQASIFVCNRVEVYSWQNGIENCQRIYLDIDEIQQKNLDDLSNPQKAEIPDEYKEYINWKQKDKQYNFTEHGTLVVWKHCTHIDHKRWTTCVSHMSEDIGRKYRYFIAEDKVEIAMCERISKKFELILANDPLYLMTPAQECLRESIIDSAYCSKKYDPEDGYTECMFELLQKDGELLGDKTYTISYENNDEVCSGEIQIKFSYVKPQYYSEIALQKHGKKPGQFPYGSTSKIKNNVGISIVREKREIDFGTFGFIDIYNAPEKRWWGCEISFDSALDNVFGISNNKQYVDLKPMSKEEMQECEKDMIYPLWMQLYKILDPTIKEMEARNSKIRDEEYVQNDDQDDKDTSSDVGEHVNNAEEKAGEEPFVPDSNMSDEEKQKEAKDELIKEGINNPNEKQIQQFINSNVRFKKEHRGRQENFITTAYIANVLVITLNLDHDFYKTFVAKVDETYEDKIAFELLLTAHMKAIYELTSSYTDAMDLLLRKINNKLYDYMVEYRHSLDQE